MMKHWIKVLLIICPLFIQARQAPWMVVLGQSFLEVKFHPDSSWKNLTHAFVPSNIESIKVAQDKIVDLITPEGNWISLKGPVEYRMNELWNLPSISVPGFRMLYQELLSIQNQSGREFYELKYPYLAERSFSKRVQLVFPVPTDLLKPQVTLIWKKFIPANQYHVFLTDRFNQVITHLVTTDTFMQLNLSTYKLERGVCHFWFIEPDTLTDSRSDELCLTWISEETEITVNEVIQRIEEEPGLSPVIKHLRKAVLLEQFKLYVEAMDQYRSALAVDPSSEEIRRIYGMFLVRIGMAKTAKEVWN